MRGRGRHRRDTAGKAAGGPARMRPWRRPTLLAALLERLGNQPDQHIWTVRCRDERGEQARLLISVTRHGVTIGATPLGLVQLTLLEFDRLRGVLRDARLTLGLDPGTEPIASGRRIPRRIVIRERPGGRGLSPDLAPPTGQPPPPQ